MIKLYEMTPRVYYNQSRDFQFIGRLYDIVLNSVKTNAELIKSLPLNEDIDTKLLDLLTMTLGFKSAHEYNVQQLRAMCSAFIDILRNKGNITSIIKACTVLVNAEGITDAITVDEPDHNTNSINIYISQGIDDVNLLKDLLDYILPAGMTYNLIKQLRINKKATTEVYVGNNVKYYIDEADQKSIISNSIINTDAIKVNQNLPANIASVTLNSTVTNTTEMLKVETKDPEQGGGTIKINNTTGKTRFAAWEPIPIKVTTDTGKKLKQIWYQIGSGGNTELTTIEGTGAEIIVKLPKTENWREVALNNKTIYLIPEFEGV